MESTIEENILQDVHSDEVEQIANMLNNFMKAAKDIIEPAFEQIAEIITIFNEFIKKIINDYSDFIQIKFANYEINNILEFESNENSMPNAPPVQQIFNNCTIINNYGNTDTKEKIKFLTFDRCLSIISILIGIIGLLGTLI